MNKALHKQDKITVINIYNQNKDAPTFMDLMEQIFVQLESKDQIEYYFEK